MSVNFNVLTLLKAGREQGNSLRALLGKLLSKLSDKDSVSSLNASNFARFDTDILHYLFFLISTITLVWSSVTIYDSRGTTIIDTNDLFTNALKFLESLF